MALQVIITAGGRLPRELQAHSPSPVKALLELGGHSLLSYALAAAEGLPELGSVAVVGGAEVQHRVPLHVMHIEEGETVVDNIHRGFRELGGKPHQYLILSPDLPFIDSAALLHFAAAARASGAALAAPLVSEQDFLARFPGAPNKFNRLDGRAVTMGSVMFMEGGLLQSNIPLMQDFYRHRKWPHRLASLVGWSLAFALLTGRLSLSAVEQRLERLTGGPARGIFGPDAGIAYDIDDKANYDYAVEHISRSAPA